MTENKFIKNDSTFKLSSSAMTNLRQQGLPTLDILREVQNFNQLQTWTGWSKADLEDAKFTVEREEYLPSIQSAINQILKPWQDNKTSEYLPEINILEISRITGLSTEKIIKTLTKNSLKVKINNLEMKTNLILPSFIEQKNNPEMTLKNSREWKINSKKIIRNSRYKSRAPGGGVVQKSRICENKFSDLIKKEILLRKIKINFTPAQKTEFLEKRIDVEVQEGLATKSTFEKKETPESLIYKQPRGAEIMEVFNWFKNNGYQKDWVLYGQEIEFAKILIEIANQKKPVNFVIWNCIGFDYPESPKNGDFPECNISSDNKSSISLYYQKRIQEVAEKLAKLGSVNLSILLPTNEAFDENVWNYKQSLDQRIQIMNEAIDFVRQGFEKVNFPASVNFHVVGWDEYLKQKNANKTPQDYSAIGLEKVTKSSNFRKILMEAIKSGQSYFNNRYGLKVDPKILAQRQPKYYGVYAGEGVFFSEQEESTCVLNFEEFRVPQMACLGSDQKLCVVTPINKQQMLDYYTWKINKLREKYV